MPLSHSQTIPADLTRIGVIAGQGDFPLLLARAAKDNGVEVFVFAINGFASEELEKIADQTFWLELGQLGKLIELLHTHSISSISMVGRVPHTSVLQYRHFDMRAVKLLAKTLNRKPDSLLSAVSQELEQENISVLDSTLFLRSLMPEPGMLTSARALTVREREDIEFGLPIAKVVAGQDIGQTIVVQEKMVIAVEGVEGTDECVLRAGKLAGSGCVVVKVSKPSQDARFDVPIAGTGTVKSMKEAGCTALALTAGECLVFDKQRVVEEADKAGIAIVAI